VNEGAILTGCVCPCCGAALHEIVSNETTILSCLSCGGLAASREQIQTMLARRWGEAVPGGSPGAEAAARVDRALTCPRCRGPMRTAPVSPALELRARWCARCDLVWFCRDELAALGLAAEAPEG
jgi:Zn-finger nucleic acid-binding protein